MVRPLPPSRHTVVRLAASLTIAAIAAFVTATTAGAGQGRTTAATLTLPVWPAHPTRVVLIGDSVAESLADALASEAASRGFVLEAFTRIGCGITDGTPVGTNDREFSARCASENQAFLERAAAEPADAVVVMSSWEVNSHIVDGRRLGFRTLEWDGWLTAQLEAIEARFHGAPTLLATVAPRAPVDGVPTMNPLDVAQVLRYNELLRSHASRFAGEVGIVDVASILCPTDPAVCPESIGGTRPRPDLGAHFDEVGARWLAPQMLDRILDARDRVGTVRTTPLGL